MSGGSVGVDRTTILTGQVSSASFGVYSADEIRKLSVVEITQSTTFSLLGQPERGGLYDPHLGPLDFDAVCPTCGLGFFECPGHMGHIELSVPLYNPIFFPYMMRLLRNMCLACGHFLHPPAVKTAFAAKLEALAAGQLVDAAKLALGVRKKSSDDDDLEFAEDDDDDDKKKKKKKPAPPVEYFDPQSVQMERVNVLGLFMRSAPSRCGMCSAPAFSFKVEGKLKVFIKPLSNRRLGQLLALPSAATLPDFFKSPSQRYVTPLELRGYLQHLWRMEPRLTLLLFGALQRESGRPAARITRPEMFFMEVVPVSPSRFRPANKANNRTVEHTHTTHLASVLLHNAQLQSAAVPSLNELTTARSGPKSWIAGRIGHWVDMQRALNALIEGAEPSLFQTPSPGIKQLLEKKEGMFRLHMMGKRVNFAARSVISPDPFIGTHEIGVPEFFAKNLTYAEPVTALNFKELARLVVNGPDVHPGANAIQDEHGRVTRLHGKSPAQRLALANTLRAVSKHAPPGSSKRVLRHLRTGDMVLVNRQPTLHKPSMMGHQVRVLSQEKPFRLHYANCKTYNADFDGDEMNMHFLQDELARSEAAFIAATDHQYSAPTDGAPLRGLIQDHICSGILLTMRDTFFTRDAFQQLLYAAVVNYNSSPLAGISPSPSSATCTAAKTRPLVVPRPAVLRPRELWTGKQVITALLQHLTYGTWPVTLHSKSKIPETMWGAGSGEGVCLVRNNELLCGVLDKNQFGSTQYGLVHACYELYSPHFAGQLLSVLSRLLTIYLQHRGFTCGIDDLLLERQADAARSELIAAAEQRALQVARTFTGLGDDSDARDVQTSLRTLLTQDERQESLLDSAMKGMTHDTSSKILKACLPDGSDKRFPHNNLALMTISGAKGGMVNFSQISCLLGQQELEGKRPPRMVSGKTLPSFTAYDLSARAGGYIADRFLTGIKPQEYYFHCMAGREGLIDTAVKTANSGYLQRCLIKQLETLRVEYDQTVRASDGTIVQFRYGEDALDVVKTPFLGQFKFIADNYAGFSQRYRAADTIPRLAAATDAPATRRRLAKQLARHQRSPAKHPLPPPPLQMLLNPGAHLGVTSDRFEAQLDAFLASPANAALFSTSRFDPRPPLSKDDFRALVYLKYMLSVVDPGEAVGLLASQSIGEPSTQMTLNTFHLAGRGEANVTLGIPRLREILMTASKQIRTPSMTLYTPRHADNADAARELAHRLDAVSLAEFIDDLSISETLSSNQDSTVRQRLYRVRLVYDLEACQENRMELARIIRITERLFLPQICKAVSKKLNQRLRAGDIGVGVDVTRFESRNGHRIVPGDDNDDDEDAATAALRLQKSERASVYDERTDADDDKQSTKDEWDASDDDNDDQKNDELEGSDDDDDLKQPIGDENEDSGLQALDDVPATPGPKKRTSHINAQPASSSSSSNDDDDVYLTSRHVTMLTAQTHVERQLLALPNMHQYRYDEATSSFDFTLALPASLKLLMLPLVEDELVKCITRHLDGIKRTYATKVQVDGQDRHCVQTDGVNLTDVFEHADMFDAENLYTNDIGAILRHYGVEAARQAIVNECAGVFAVYGIGVDFRHLSLVADFMTIAGKFNGFNRMAIRAQSSPLLKASFETTMSFIRDAAMHGESDDLKSPAARLVVGQPVTTGTGAFELLVAPMSNN